jgi:hypothetical protein
LITGGAGNCSCACSGPSSTMDNCTANIAGGYQSSGDMKCGAYWG